MKLKFSLTAIKDLKRLKSFIQGKNPAAATKYIDRLKHSINVLLDQPHLGKIVEEQPAAREIISGDYFVRYTIKGQFIYILMIWHSKEERN